MWRDANSKQFGHASWNYFQNKGFKVKSGILGRMVYVKNGKVAEIANLAKSEIASKTPQVYLMNLSIMPAQPTLPNPSQGACTNITMRS